MSNEYFPQIGDIWRGENNDYFLVMSEPRYCNEEKDLSINVLWLDIGLVEQTYFSVDEKTGMLNEWWVKIA